MTEQDTPHTLTGIDSVDRARQLESWDSAKAEELARQEGINLSDDHHKVLNFLREYYIENGWPQKVHTMSQILGDTFEQQGGNKYLHKLFPGGPLAQGARIAGLPPLAHSEDKSFGSVQ